MKLVWCEVNTRILGNNIRAFRRLVEPNVLLAPVIKGNAYGHGLIPAARAFLEGGADWLCVNALYELRALREAGIDAPIYLVGYVAREDLAEASALSGRLVVYNRESIEVLGQIVEETGVSVNVHLKLETGNNRQGVPQEEALELASLCVRNGLRLEGLASHFANIEDTTDHTFALMQLDRFKQAVHRLRKAGHPLPICHVANSAATLLWSKAQMDLVRVGIASYGLWPSTETFVSAVRECRERIAIAPALTWKTRVVQVKELPSGDFIGYGLSYRATHPTRLAILPVGYYDGYPRQASNLGHVLIRGRRAPIRGRVCMNIIMADITHIPGVVLEDEVVLLGKQEEEIISAEQLAGWSGTINYDVISRIADHVPRCPCA